MHIYINYPNPHFTIHKDSSCPQIHMHQKSGQRLIRVNPLSLKIVLSQFINDAHVFKSEAQFNDLWLDVSLPTAEQEIGLVHMIQALLSQRYQPLGSAPITDHC